MAIQWFPGHMHKARKEMAMVLPDTDVIVEVLDVYLGDEDMDCTPSEWVRIIGGTGTLTCTLDGLDEDEPAYRTSLGVQLGYNYKDSITKRVTIKRIE